MAPNCYDWWHSVHQCILLNIVLNGCYYTSKEQKYRFNQFYDITNDRGEFTNAQQAIFDTECNGYIRNLNPTNLNYNKAQLQHKKFRHYYNHVLLRRTNSLDRKMLLRLHNTKLLLSRR